MASYVYRFKDKNNRVIYYGKTIDMDRRMQDHFTKGHLPKNCYDSVCVIEFQKFKTESDSLIYETYYITKYDPTYNKQGKSRDIPTLKLEEKEWKVYKVIKHTKPVAVPKVKWLELISFGTLGYIIYKILEFLL